MTEADGPILYDRDYVKTCLEKVIESKPPGYHYPEDEANRYFLLKREGEDECITPMCLVGHVLADIGVSERTIRRIATSDDDAYNGMTFRDLVTKLQIPVTEEAIALLISAQDFSDSKFVWDAFSY